MGPRSERARKARRVKQPLYDVLASMGPRSERARKVERGPWEPAPAECFNGAALGKSAESRGACGGAPDGVWCFNGAALGKSAESWLIGGFYSGIST